MSVRTDLLIDRDGTKDLVIQGGDLQIVTGLNAAAQRLHLRLSMQKGEWFLDLREGVPWREDIMVRSPDIPAISAVFQERILSMEGVIRLDSFSLVFDNTTGLLTLDFVAIVEEGAVQVTGVGEDLAALLVNLFFKPVGGIA